MMLNEHQTYEKPPSGIVSEEVLGGLEPKETTGQGYHGGGARAFPVEVPRGGDHEERVYGDHDEDILLFTEVEEGGEVQFEADVVGEEPSFILMMARLIL